MLSASTSLALLLLYKLNRGGFSWRGWFLLLLYIFTHLTRRRVIRWTKYYHARNHRYTKAIPQPLQKRPTGTLTISPRPYWTCPSDLECPFRNAHPYRPSSLSPVPSPQRLVGLSGRDYHRRRNFLRTLLFHRGLRGLCLTRHP